MTGSYLAACAIFRNEGPYLAEWVAFHRLVGVEHFFLYDNGSDDRPEAALAPFLELGCVTLQPWPVPFHEGATKKAYADALCQARGRFRWLACLDLDEFLFSPRERMLTRVLPDYEEYPGVVVRWQVYGSSGEERASNLPVIARFTHRARSDWIRNRRVKSIVDPNRAVEAATVHCFTYCDGALAVTERKEPVELGPRPRWNRPLRRLHGLLGPAQIYFDPYGGRRITNRTVSVEHLRINHYMVKSRAEFLRKAQLKREKGRYEGVDYFRYHDRNEVFDPILCSYLPELLAALQEH